MVGKPCHWGLEHRRQLDGGWAAQWAVDTATFAFSNITTVLTGSGLTEVNGIVFNAGASVFTINATEGLTLIISGVGITNNSAIMQNFVAATFSPGPAFGTIAFTNSATAGSLTMFSNHGATLVSSPHGGRTQFFDTSTAGTGTFINGSGTALGSAGGHTDFFDRSTAGSGTFTNVGGVNFSLPAYTSFHDSSTAGNGTFINNAGRLGVLTVFLGNSDGGTARIEIFGTGKLDISSHNPPGVTTGSIEGSGLVYLGANNLTVGSNNLNTTFSGVIQDGGSLGKIGTGTLTLSNASGYTGGTTITKGTLLVANIFNSGTGTGAVQVNKGTLGGTGIITGAVTVGTGTTSGAILLAGNSATSPGTLTVNNTLTFNSLSTYKCVLNRSTVQASKATALGVTINSNVPFTFVDTGTGTLTTGTVFTVIDNTSANPIFGTFSNLSDGSVFTSNGNNFQASYTGGTGNDLTLTVVP